jgi:hypothetical protein
MKKLSDHLKQTVDNIMTTIKNTIVLRVSELLDKGIDGIYMDDGIIFVDFNELGLEDFYIDDENDSEACDHMEIRSYRNEKEVVVLSNYSEYLHKLNINKQIQLLNLIENIK